MTPRAVDQLLFQLRDVLAVTEARANTLGSYRQYDDVASAHDATVELCRVVRNLDAILTRGDDSLPTEWLSGWERPSDEEAAANADPAVPHVSALLFLDTETTGVELDADDG